MVLKLLNFGFIGKICFCRDKFVEVTLSIELSKYGTVDLVILLGLRSGPLW